MTVEEAMKYARMRRADLYKIEGFEESWDHETIAEVLADRVEELEASMDQMDRCPVCGKKIASMDCGCGQGGPL